MVFLQYYPKVYQVYFDWPKRNAFNRIIIQVSISNLCDYHRLSENLIIQFFIKIKGFGFPLPMDLVL